MGGRGGGCQSSQAGLHSSSKRPFLKKRWKMRAKTQGWPLASTPCCVYAYKKKERKGRERLRYPCHVWWLMPVILTLWRLAQDGWEFKAIVDEVSKKGRGRQGGKVLSTLAQMYKMIFMATLTQREDTGSYLCP